MLNEINLYISPNGNDNNSGKMSEPFKTPKRALDEVRGLNKAENNITVYFMSGDYRLSNLNLDEACGGIKDNPVKYKAYGDGEVIINGGKTLKNADFKPVSDTEMYKRFKPEARDKISVIDLAAEGITKEDIGPMYAVGCANTSKEHNDGTYGNNCEVFWNDQRLTLARYPNKGFHKVEEVLEPGDRDILLPGVIKLQGETIDEIRTWKEPEKAWMFGYFMFDWAEQTTPLKSIDTKTGIVQPRHYSIYGYRAGGEYYFLNVPEELDCEGEYCIDRDNMMLYIYPPEDCKDADALISVSNDTLITGNVSNITFEGIIFKGVRNDVIVLDGDNITIKNCRVLNSYGKGIVIDGWNSYVYGCEVAYMGKGGVYLTGGDRATLTPGNCVVENCYIHHFEEVFRTYQQGIFIIGCGNKAIHNEIAYAPHLAMSYSGNDHLIAYNYVHHVVYESNDAGALYVGGDWTSYGTVVKYNLFEKIGGIKGKWPISMYFDDGMSACTVYGNITVNNFGNGIMIGGGRDMHVHNNLFISEVNPFHYDARMGKGGWADIYAKTKPGEGMWTTLMRVPYNTSELWKERFPRLASVITDYEQNESPDFPANPAYSVVSGNVFIGPYCGAEHWVLEDEVKKYSTVADNYIFGSDKNVLKPGTYELVEGLVPGFERIPYDEIGRYGYRIDVTYDKDKTSQFS